MYHYMYVLVPTLLAGLAVALPPQDHHPVSDIATALQPLHTALVVRAAETKKSLTGLDETLAEIFPTGFKRAAEAEAKTKKDGEVALDSMTSIPGPTVPNKREAEAMPTKKPDGEVALDKASTIALPTLPTKA